MKAEQRATKSVAEQESQTIRRRQKRFPGFARNNANLAFDFISQV